MNMDDLKLNESIHCLTKIVTELKNMNLSNIALKVEEVREEILMAIKEGKDDSNDT